ncbi:MAG: hypothetical protein R3B06_09710 [Kofleriaceae bacterium]
MSVSIRGAAAIVLSCLALAACGSARPHYASARMAEAPAAAAPPPLDRSLFARDPQGALTEDALQQILAAPIELDLPARVGVIPVVTATDWRGPNPDYLRVPAGVAPFVRQLRGSEPFTLVTEVMPIPSGALGMEALREVAARYRLRYVMLYREVIATKSTAGPIAWGYATIVGAAFLPGQEHAAYGYIEASMFDVKTGLLMFTTRRAVLGQRRSNLWHQDDKLARLASTLATRSAPALADDVKTDLYRFADAAKVENDRRSRVARGDAPSLALPPPAAVASDR